MDNDEDDDIAWLSQQETAAILEDIRSKLANRFGVTLQTDHCGEWGDAGTTYLTIRTKKDKQHVEATFKLLKVRSRG